jgi:preprotein translocase subunit SecE
VARNRKRRNDRRPRRPADDESSRPGLATARAQRDAQHDENPDPLQHATPDVELAEAQLALGRPELGAPVDEDSYETLQSGGADDGSDLDAGGADGGGGIDDGGPDDGDIDGGGLDDGGSGSLGAELAPRGRSVPSLRGGGRLVHFLQGSWRELQRVQWPDRRQVMQATGVVIGFVIVAGVFLGLSDFVAGKIINLILK